MRKSITDRNILFGIFALQNGFISRQALLTAMKTWTLNKQKFMSQVLQEQGAIDPETFELLQALVRKYLALHGNDAGKSLAALNAPADDLLDELARISDSDVRGSLAQASTEATVDLVPETTVSVAVGASSSRGLRFRILRPHAQGGLGLVYVAHDEELNRDVALKEIQGHHADHPESRTRFMLEAEITGGLEHPGIVPVYGLGQYADGRPFYAMRFIRGDSLKDAIAKFHADARPWREKSLELRELLERLIDVCNAMQYAHDRGVLHRDLKPGNIMLGRYGETLVVDWGLAKPMGAVADPHAPSLSEEPMLRPSSASGSAATMQGSAVGTPQYMSPEQAAGRLDQLGPASDIYSLGATLYCLLTGKAPFENLKGAADRPNMQALLQRVQAGDFPAPRQRNADISPPLEAICLKAMARDPGERYATPRALIDDIKHWLADEPVSAWPEPWNVRTRRWMSRHRTLVTGVAAAFVVGVASLLVATALLVERNMVIEGKNTELFNANVAIQAESQEREKQRLLAVAAQRKAEERLDQSVETLKLFALDARSYCEDAVVPGDSKQKLFNVLADQLDALAATEEDKEFNEDKVRARIFLNETVALVQIELGRSNEAEKSLQKALKLAERWLAAKPDDPAALGRHAAVLHLFGVTHGRRLNAKLAEKFYTQAYEIRLKLLGNEKVERFTPGKTRMDVADSLDAMERWDDAIQMRVQALAFVRKHIEASGGKPGAEYAALDSLNWTYQKAAMAASDYPKKKAYMDNADSTSADLIKLRPTGRVALDRWAKMARTYGQVEQRQAEQAIAAKQPEQAKVHLTAARTQFRKYADLAARLATAPDLLDARRLYADAWYELARAEKILGETTAAKQHVEHCLLLREELLRDYPRSPNTTQLKVDRLAAVARLGRHEVVAQEADMLRIKFADKRTMFQLAATYSICVGAVEESKLPAKLTDKDQKLQAVYRDNAIECLELAVRAGFDNWEMIRTDPDLTAIRDEPRFRKILDLEKRK